MHKDKCSISLTGLGDKLDKIFQKEKKNVKQQTVSSARKEETQVYLDRDMAQEAGLRDQSKLCTQMGDHQRKSSETDNGRASAER
jgi:hypothetical protein